MKKLLISLSLGMALFAGDGPEYTKDGQMIRPQDYREWVYLSSGIGMTYGPLKAEASNANPPFDNVFVSRAAYKSFQETGAWPDKTVFVLEVRAAQSKGSINQGGHFQGDILGVEAHVKDDRLPGKWGFFGFRNGDTTSKMVPTNASCYSCHAQHGAVDTTFVQFYPSLIAVAKQKGTYKLAALETPATATVVDAVCKMPIDPNTAAAKSVYKGKTYYFDDPNCKRTFDESPEKFAN